MPDMPKSLRTAATTRWILLSVAVALTATSGVLGWIEVAEKLEPAPRAFVWGMAMVAWIAWIALCCALFVVQRVNKRICRMETRLLEAITARRIENLAQCIEDSNVRSINERR